MILYFTYNDQPSGVYWSQVTDVVAHLNTLGGPRVQLLALVSGREYFSIRKKIRGHCPGTLVLPMVPRMKNWRSNRFLLRSMCRLLRPSSIIARGALATAMALDVRGKGGVRKVCFDGRGAYAAEWEEYRIIDDDALIAQFRPVESEAVCRSDLRIAVSNALVDHWKERYGYIGQDHVVVPCTLGRSHLVDRADPAVWRKQLEVGEEDVLLVYSGSTAGWQSFDLLESVMRDALAGQPNVKVLFLSPPESRIDELARVFPGRVLTTWVLPNEVPAVLRACDMALLLREDSITNRVASPTKFAEYLACGLPVLISEHIGDFSEWVRTMGIGHVLAEDQALPSLLRPTPELRGQCRHLAMDRFSKAAHDKAYKLLLNGLE